MHVLLFMPHPVLFVTSNVNTWCGRK